MRLDKYLAETAQCTRSEAKTLLQKGKVTVNGTLCKKGDTQLRETDVVAVEGRPLAYQKFVYIMLNKPEGVVSASTDKRDTTVVDLLGDAYPRRELFPAGRLDKTSTGFVLLTDDGGFAHDILAPKRHVSKTYTVTLDTPLTAEMKAGFAAGVTLADGTALSPAEVEALTPDGLTVRVLLKQGVYHQIKRMFGIYGAGVNALHRDAIGDAEGNQYKVVSEIDGVGTSAQMTPVMGSDGSGLAHEHWMENLKLAVALQDNILQSYPTLMRPILLRNSRYNQHATTGSLLVEVGAAGNSPEEAALAGRLFAQQMAELGIMDTTGRVDVLALFGNNVRATVFSIAYGFIPFIYLPALSIGINSLLLGLFAGVYVNNGISLLAYFAGIVPHGIFELPALILALSSGIYLCRKVTDYVRHNEKGVMGPLMKDLLRLFVMHIIPLLVAAAMMEAYVTPQLLKLFL